MLMSWLRKWYSGQTPSRRPRRPAQAAGRATFMPAVEGLEERQMLSAAGLFAASAFAPDAVWFAQGNVLSEHVGTDPNTGWSHAFIPVPGTIQQVSAAKTDKDAAFVRDSHGDVYLYERTGSFIAGPVKVADHAADISAAAVQPGAVFVISSVNQSVAEYIDFNGIHMYPLGTPASGQGPFKATQVSAGKDSVGNDAVFVNFNGALYEHAGATPPGVGWSYITGTNLSGPYNPFTASAVTDISASRVQNDTVFVVQTPVFQLSPNGGSLTEYVGQGTGSNNPPPSYTPYAILSSGVAQVSAGTDTYGNPAAFVLDTSGSLDQYTYHPGSLIKGFPAYWSKTHIANTATELDASQAQANTVYYSPGGVRSVHGQLFENSNLVNSLVWAALT